MIVPTLAVETSSHRLWLQETVFLKLFFKKSIWDCIHSHTHIRVPTWSAAHKKASGWKHPSLLLQKGMFDKVFNKIQLVPLAYLQLATIRISF